MSTILDALKKSEQDRKQQRIPTLMDSPLPKEPSKWPWYLVALCLLLLAGGLSYVLWKLPSQTSPLGEDRGVAASRQQLIAVQNSSNSESNSSMNLSVISYTDDAQQRFVMIDENLLREGDYLRAGTRVLEIRSDSVIIDQRGDQFELKP